MKFKKEDLQALVRDEYDREIFEELQTEQIDSSRWSAIYETIFKYQGKLYSTTYSRGLTEFQDESPYEYADEEIECQEVEAYYTTITAYRTVQ